MGSLISMPCKTDDLISIRFLWCKNCFKCLEALSPCSKTISISWRGAGGELPSPRAGERARRWGGVLASSRMGRVQVNRGKEKQRNSEEQTCLIRAGAGEATWETRLTLQAPARQKE
ncbi:unnamed protein product, partial [Gulo gulo]